VTDEGIEVEVTIVNDQTGHHVPADSPVRLIILLVRAVADGGEIDILLAHSTCRPSFSEFYLLAGNRT
jgi:hypothetical protein